MQGTIERYGNWFCSDRCIKEFERLMKAQPERHGAAPACHVAQKASLRDPLIWVPVSGIVLSTAGWWWPAATNASAIYVAYLPKVGIPLLVGLLIGGLIDHFVPKEYIVHLLAGQRKRVIARATLIGFLASTCSHGCLALALELHRKGASIPAVVSFLLASPWANMSLTLIILSLFGLKGLAIVICALVISLITGLIFQQLALRNLIEANPNMIEVSEGFSIRQDFISRWHVYAWTRQQMVHDGRGVLHGALSLGRMVLGWVQLGLVMSALLGALVPHDALMRFFGPSMGGLLLTLLAATIIEVCSEGTAPLAFELYRHTGALGNAFAFLMGGVVTDYTELAAFWANIGRRTVLWMLLITLPLVIILGWCLNAWI